MIVCVSWLRLKDLFTNLEGIPEISAYYKRILVLLGYDPVGIARISSFEPRWK